MARDRKLSAADPELEQSRVDIDQRRASETGQQFGRNGVMEVQQQVRAFKDGLRFRTGEAHVLFWQAVSDLRVIARVKNEFVA